jgi:hypothetical protein
LIFSYLGVLGRHLLKSFASKLQVSKYLLTLDLQEMLFLLHFSFSAIILLINYWHSVGKQLCWNGLKEMKIKTRCYLLKQKVGYGEGGEILLENRRMLPLDPMLKDEARPFYFDQANLTITCERGDKLSRVTINQILTEADYARDQREYLVYLNWVQQQKLHWMFRKHWLQSKEAKKHMIFLSVFLVLVFIASLYFFGN